MCNNGLFARGVTASAPPYNKVYLARWRLSTHSRANDVAPHLEFRYIYRRTPNHPGDLTCSLLTAHLRMHTRTCSSHMDLLEKIRHLWAHTFWADARLLDVLHADAPPEALREFSHILGAEETWLARIERRPPRTGVWPGVSFDELRSLMHGTHDAYRTYVAALDAGGLAAAVTYTNSAGQRFTNPVGDILLHVALHGQYHRGKVNLLLRQAGHTPAATDYIAFMRGAPAATETLARDGANAP